MSVNLGSNENQGEPIVIRHGLERGILPDAIKSTLVSRGLGDSLTRTIEKYVPGNGIGAYPCLVLDQVRLRKHNGISIAALQEAFGFIGIAGDVGEEDRETHTRPP